ncbi:transmembrane protein 225 [Octodon degus]|uniref:Transmembrane protein 225 n=1 Tax=Octodon degus TaxID=10160 RepID=A0A6P6EWZ6_OCTDE|nr:transmembrane protein 225 [Octodon degus]
MSKRNIQATNLLFSSWAVISLMIGIFIKEWVELVPRIKKDKTSHSPWMTCCSTIWPEDSLKVVRIMMVLVLCLSFFLNLTLGMQYAYMIPQNKYIHLITALICFLTGVLCLLQCKQPTYSCTCQKIHPATTQCVDTQLSGQSIQVISLPARTSMPRSIVHTPCQQSEEDAAKKEHLQKRHVTWAL